VKRIALVLLVACLHVNCGYALAGRGSFLPSYIRTVGIPRLENRSTFFQVEEILTEKIRVEFIGRGKYMVIPEAAGADAVLTGEILGISVQPVALNEQQLASRYLFTLSMRVQFTDTKTMEVLWSNDSLTFREEYDLATRSATAIEGATFLDQERSSVDRIASDVARTVVTAILEAF
jgi:lipopolysaccharide assembly LptE-like protein